MCKIINTPLTWWALTARLSSPHFRIYTDMLEMPGIALWNQSIFLCVFWSNPNQNPVRMIHYINKLKDRNHMIFSIDA